MRDYEDNIEDEILEDEYGDDNVEIEDTMSDNDLGSEPEKPPSNAKNLPKRIIATTSRWDL